MEGYGGSFTTKNISEELGVCTSWYVLKNIKSKIEPSIGSFSTKRLTRVKESEGTGVGSAFLQDGFGCEDLHSGI